MRVILLLITFVSYTRPNRVSAMLITTTSAIEGKKITQYIGIVNGEAIIGANLVKDFFTSIRDVVGGQTGAYVQALREAKSIAMKEMVDQATRLGANTIIGVDLDYQTIGGNGAMLMVSANGTAVVTENIKTAHKRLRAGGNSSKAGNSVEPMTQKFG